MIESHNARPDSLTERRRYISEHIIGDYVIRPDDTGESLFAAIMPSIDISIDGWTAADLQDWIDTQRPPAPVHTYTMEREDGDVTLWKRDDGRGLAARATNWRNARRSFARLIEEEDTRIDAATAEKKEITLASADFQPGRWHWLRTPRCYCICSKCAEEWANSPTRDTSMAPMAGAVAKGLKCVHCGRRKS